MHITEVRLDPELTHLALSGKLDASGLQGTDIKFSGYTAARRKPTLVDMSQVEFIASLGIGMLISCAKALRLHGAGMVVVNPSEPVDRALRTTGIDKVIPIVATVEEGLRLLGAGA